MSTHGIKSIKYGKKVIENNNPSSLHLIYGPGKERETPAHIKRASQSNDKMKTSGQRFSITLANPRGKQTIQPVRLSAK